MKKDRLKLMVKSLINLPLAVKVLLVIEIIFALVIFAGMLILLLG